MAADAAAPDPYDYDEDEQENNIINPDHGPTPDPLEGMTVHPPGSVMPQEDHQSDGGFPAHTYTERVFLPEFELISPRNAFTDGNQDEDEVDEDEDEDEDDDNATLRSNVPVLDRVNHNVARRAAFEGTGAVGDLDEDEFDSVPGRLDSSIPHEDLNSEHDSSLEQQNSSEASNYGNAQGREGGVAAEAVVDDEDGQADDEVENINPSREAPEGQ